MTVAPVVVAFSESRALRETLSVLLEHDCRLRFLGLDRVPPSDPMLADLALVATRHSAGLLHELTRRWPTLPIVAVQMADTAPRLPLSYRHIASVPLEPHAIRTVVLHKLSGSADAALRMHLEAIAEALRAELTHALEALRACATLRAVGSGGDAHVMALMIQQQSRIIAEAIDHLQRFCARPIDMRCAPEFADTLCRELQRRDDAPGERTLLYECASDPSALRHPGPVALIALVATFLRAHLRRRCDAPVVRVTTNNDGIELRYPPRPAFTPAAPTWPLLLARLALQPSSWRLSSTFHEHEEAIRLSPE